MPAAEDDFMPAAGAFEYHLTPTPDIVKPFGKFLAKGKKASGV